MLVHPGKSHTIKTIAQHFHWSSLATDVKQHVQLCATCQHYKKQCKKYDHLPVKTQPDLDPWEEVHVDLIGPWIVPQPPIKPSKHGTTGTLLFYMFFLFLEIHILMMSVINNTVALSPGELSCISHLVCFLYFWSG